MLASPNRPPYRRTDLKIIRIGALTGQLYRDVVIRPAEVPYAAVTGDDLILMDDNCMPHIFQQHFVFHI